MELFTDPNAWAALATLTVLEIVLGVDNVVFISILSSRLPESQQAKARSLGLGLALAGRVLLLLSLTWVMKLDGTLFTVLAQDLSGRDLILLGGGLFLIAKATHEIHVSMEGEHASDEKKGNVTFRSVLLQILVLDLVFSLDSVITAVGMADQIPVMIAAIVLAMVFMIMSAGAVSSFIQKHPTVKMLALSFLLLVGMALLAESFDLHIPRGYVYFAMAFSVFVEVLNPRGSARRKAKRAAA